MSNAIQDKDRRPAFTYILMACMALFFVLDLLVLVPSGTQLLTVGRLIQGRNPGWLTMYGGVVPELVQAGQVWRLATALVLHSGLMNIAASLIAVFIVAPLLEHEIGSLCTALVFLGTGIVSNMVLVALGASGVGAAYGVAGLVGILIVLAIRRQAVRRRVGIVEWMAMGIYLVAPATTSGIFPLAAHAAGIAAGLILGFAFLVPVQKESPAAEHADAILDEKDEVTPENPVRARKKTVYKAQPAGVDALPESDLKEQSGAQPKEPSEPRKRMVYKNEPRQKKVFRIEDETGK